MQSEAFIKQPLVDGVVTFLDILGWKGVYDRDINALHKLSLLIQKLQNEGEQHRGKNTFGELTIKSISDTIVIFSNCTTNEASVVIDIHGELADWTIRNSLVSGIPVRGAIAFGEFANQENIFIGKAVDEAAAWHEYSDWIGVHLTPSAEFVYKETKGNNTWVKYNPPNKHRLEWDPHCVNWTKNWLHKNEEKEKLKDIFRKLGPITPNIADKFTNTLAFIDKINNKTKKRYFNIFE